MGLTVKNHSWSKRTNRYRYKKPRLEKVQVGNRVVEKGGGGVGGVSFEWH